MMSRIVPVGTVVCALLLSGCGDAASDGASTDDTTASLLAQPASDGRSTPVVAADPGIVVDGPRVEVAELGYNRGDSLAIVKVVELSDFGCGYCRRFHDETFPTLLEEFIESGKVEWKFVPYITGMFDNSLAATEAAECVMEQSDDAYEQIAQRMWQEQGDWKNSSDPEPLIRGWVSELDVDVDTFDACLTEDRRLNRIASATMLARQIGVRGTPTFVVIGYPPLQGALPTEFFQDILNTVHAEELRKRQEGEPTG